MFMVFAAMPLFGDPLDGDYKVRGYDPYEKKEYEGFAHLKNVGNGIYEAYWEVGEPMEIYTGTGIRDGNSLIFVFKIKYDHGGKVGIQNYTISNGKLTGYWIYHNKQARGKETLEKINR
jgi:hypothetical protein